MENVPACFHWQVSTHGKLLLCCAWQNCSRVCSDACTLLSAMWHHVTCIDVMYSAGNTCWQTLRCLGGGHISYGEQLALSDALFVLFTSNGAFHQQNGEAVGSFVLKTSLSDFMAWSASNKRSSEMTPGGGMFGIRSCIAGAGGIDD